MSDETNELDNLKSEATQLGINFSTKIGAVKLKEKIEDHYESLETSGKALAETVKEVEEKEAKQITSTSTKTGDFNALRIAKEKAARKTRIITITDNDQRVNNHVSTCTVNCSNAYFSLGTRVLPLGEKIEVAQGHINVLKEVTIPLHVKNVKTGLSETRMRKRFSVSYEDV